MTVCQHRPYCPVSEAQIEDIFNIFLGIRGASPREDGGVLRVAPAVDGVDAVRQVLHLHRSEGLSHIDPYEPTIV